LGICFEGRPGRWNAITDVPGVTVGHTTLVSGEGKLVVGRGPVRTGVTAVFPRGVSDSRRVFAASFSLNGNGEMTGSHWLEESGWLEGPVVLTNTHSVGTVRDTVVDWLIQRGRTAQSWVMPVVAETYDGYLNDINGFHVHRPHVLAAITSAATGPVSEGNVGGGTGMICHEFKGGIGTASRSLETREHRCTIGALVQANHGLRKDLRIDGVPVGRDIREHPVKTRDEGSIVIVLATDAPLLPHQLKRIARRASLGLGRTGSTVSNFSGDLFLAFSTANFPGSPSGGPFQVTMLADENLDPLFDATVQVVEEAIINSLLAAENMTGRDYHRVVALPIDRLCTVMKKYGRPAENNG
jgi:L-aminopeptidase/D-esterase-like protein